LHEEGFEPSHHLIVGLKSTALDHSAIRALYRCRFKFAHKVCVLIHLSATFPLNKDARTWAGPVLRFKQFYDLFGSFAPMRD
jgi:hypothetical protein